MNHPNYTLEQLKAEPHYSYSAFNSYLNICQLQYFYRYLEKREPEQTPVALPFGSAFHAALTELAHAVKQGRALVIDELTDAFATFFKSNCDSSAKVVFKKEDTRDDLIVTARQMLEVVTKEWIDYQNIEALALPFKIEFPGLSKPLIGELDMVVNEDCPFNEQSGTPCVVDFKTAARQWPDDKAGKDLQATVFSYAFHKAYGRKPVFRFDIITKAKKPTLKRLFTNRNTDDFERLETLFRAAEHAINDGVFLPNETSFACGDCPYAGGCAAWHRCSQSSYFRKEAAA